jgi:LCP family protein required for cell wall assembly
MVIVHVPADGSRASLISLPRDSYVEIPGFGMNRLNSAYAQAYLAASGSPDARKAAGANELIKTVDRLTGLHIDHFVQVSLLGFVTISDAVGGVWVDLCHDVDDSVARNRRVYGNGGSGLVLPKGRHRIQGVQALQFVRQRHFLDNGDIDRAARQRYFLAAAFRQVASAGTLLDPGKLGNLVTAVKHAIWADDGLNMLELAKQLSNLSADNITGQVIPTDHYWHDSPVGDVGVVVPAAVRAFVHKMIAGGPSDAYRAAKTVAPDSVTVRVLNASARDHAAADAATTLRRAGFRSSVDATQVPTRAATTISYPVGMEAAAKTLARYVPGAEVGEAKVSGVTLTLGTDGRAAVTTPRTAPRHGTGTTKPIDASCIN